MAAATILKSVPLGRSLRLTHNRIFSGAVFLHQAGRPFCEATKSAPLDEDLNTSSLTAEDPPKPRICDDPNYRKWKVVEEEILSDVGPTVSLAKDILHSGRYLDGERLTAEDEQKVVNNLLKYHPNAEDKIGCGLDGIMVDRHPRFRQSRCLFVVRTDGGWIDFSYQKCLRAYLWQKYPNHAERFIQGHFKRGSG